MEAGRLKSMGDRVLDGTAVANLTTKINTWKSKSA
jgi:hypothetical protein